MTSSLFEIFRVCIDIHETGNAIHKTRRFRVSTSQLNSACTKSEQISVRVPTSYISSLILYKYYIIQKNNMSIVEFYKLFYPPGILGEGLFGDLGRELK